MDTLTKVYFGFEVIDESAAFFKHLMMTVLVETLNATVM
jgi:hypothetical protein